MWHIVAPPAGADHPDANPLRHRHRSTLRPRRAGRSTTSWFSATPRPGALPIEMLPSRATAFPEKSFQKSSLPVSGSTSGKYSTTGHTCADWLKMRCKLCASFECGTTGSPAASASAQILRPSVSPPAAVDVRLQDVDRARLDQLGEVPLGVAVLAAAPPLPGDRLPQPPVALELVRHQRLLDPRELEFAQALCHARARSRGPSPCTRRRPARRRRLPPLEPCARARRCAACPRRRRAARTRSAASAA